MKKLIALLLCAFTVLGCALFAGAEENTTLTAPSDFTFDPATGNYSFVANDENMGYYFIRFYAVKDGAYQECSPSFTA